MNRLMVIALLFISISINAQSQQELALEKAMEAIQMMDAGQVDESIEMLKECEKLDPGNFVYPYEIAYALVLKEDYEQAIDILNKVKTYKNSNSQVYQLSGNCYSWLGDPEQALKEYAAGLKIFPEAANLFLETANIYYAKENYNEAVKYYRGGIEANPMFPSNYYNLAMIFLDGKNKLSGLIYGEIFMNIERDSERTQIMSERLFKAYQEAIVIDGNETKYNFCEIVVTDSDFKGKKVRLPFCAAYFKHMAISTVGMKEVNLNALSDVRINFVNYFFEKDAKKYPNILFQYHNKMSKDNVFDAYNHYILQLGAPEEFELWRSENEEAYNEFISWYTNEKNYLQINSKNAFIKL